jgi:hypothetical protein
MSGVIQFDAAAAAAVMSECLLVSEVKSILYFVLSNNKQEVVTRFIRFSFFVEMK